MQRHKDHIRSAIIAAVVAALVSSAGTFAASHYLISQINQISPQVRKELRKPGPRGIQGPGGAVSFFTDVGPKGERGPQGLPGNSGVVEVRSAGPIGATGPEGPKGPVGNQGIAGAPGMPFSGPWDVHTHYGRSNVVSFGGAFWLSLKNTVTEPNIEHEPVKGSEWWGEL